MLDLFVAWIGNLKFLCIFFAIIFPIIGVFAAFMAAESCEFEPQKAKNFIKTHIFNKVNLFFYVLILFLSTVPNMDDLWKTRIALIKFELASPENVQAGVATIERVGKELEQKYLVSEKEKKGD